ncbi:MAG: Omp28-related outer membrane protein [Bacteroidia bacterium]
MKHLPILLLSLIFLASCGTDEQPEPKDICGCTDKIAANFSQEANCDDGSCVYLDDEMRTLNTFFTSTGCGACGIYGIDCFTGYSEKMLDKALPFELHFKYGDPMINETNDSFVQVARPSWSPFFAVGLQQSMVIGQDRPEACELSDANAEKLINDFYSKFSRTQIGITQVIKNDTLNAHFAINTMGLQNLKYAVYVLEDSFVFTQNAGWRNDIEGWVHNHVVRDAITPVFGTPINVQQKKGMVQIPINSEWKTENIYTMLVLWNTENALPEVVNAERSY